MKSSGRGPAVVLVGTSAAVVVSYLLLDFVVGLTAVVMVGVALWSGPVGLAQSVLGRRSVTRRRRLSEGIDWIVMCRLVAAGCQGLTAIVTWDLWQVRSDPPMFPVLDLAIPQVGVGIPLLCSLAVVLVRPSPGLALHLAILSYAFMADQTRLQPSVVSLALVLVGTSDWVYGPTVARAHLVTLWFWSGTHKLLSTGFMTGSALFIYDGLPYHPSFVRDHFGWLVAGLELAVAVCTVLTRTRRVGMVLAVLLHGSILLVLSPLGQDWNESVWPWNIALAVAAVAFFRRGREEGAVAGGRPWHRYAIATFLALFPMGFYLGLADAYLTHNLYTSNTASAQICDTAGACRSGAPDTFAALNVPIPPEPRIYRAYFHHTCEDGERLIVRPRAVRVLLGWNEREQTYACPARK